MIPSSPQTALVTGASRGLGRAIALALSSRGHRICINYRTDEDGGRQTLELIEQQGGNAVLCPFDVADGTACENALKTLIRQEERVDILVNNAGIRRDGLLARMKFDAWQAVIDTNLSSLYHVTRPIVKKMIMSRYGRIVNITSASGQTGVAGQFNYAAAKAGVIGATRSLAREVASRNITVNAVSPGYIATEMTADLDTAHIEATIPMGRMGTPEEVAAVVAFLCTSEAAYITGQVIGVNGGVL